MAKSKSTAKKNIVTSEVIAAVRAVAANEAKVARNRAEREGALETIRHRQEHPREYLADRDIIEVAARLESMLYSERALRQLAQDCISNNGDSWECFATAVKEMTRSNIKGLDACGVRLIGGPGAGNFESEFATD